MTTKMMRVLEAKDFAIDALKLGERPVPKPRRGEILVRIRAASLNFETWQFWPRVPAHVAASLCAGVGCVR